MELDWTTFIFEIINFLVLIWILQHFLYKPVLAVITRRQTEINDTLQQAQQLQEEAEQLQTQYKNRLTEWDDEKQAARQSLSQEIESHRAKKLEEVRAELDSERQKADILAARKLTEQQQQAEVTALYQATRFTSSLFTQLAGPDVEQRLINRFIDDLAKLPEHQQHTIQASMGPTTNEVLIASAYPLAQSVCDQLESLLKKIVGQKVEIKYTQDEELIAGLRVTIGAFVLQANLKDELQSFARFAHDDSDYE